MKILHALFTARPRVHHVPAATVAQVTYQTAHDLACGLNPERERTRRAQEKADLSVRHRPYTAEGRAKFDAERTTRHAQTPTRHVSYDTRRLPVPPRIDLDFTAPPAPHIDVTTVHGPADCVPDDLLDAEAARSDGQVAASTFEPDTAGLSEAELNDPALLASLRTELQGAVARASTRAMHRVA